MKDFNPSLWMTEEKVKKLRALIEQAVKSLTDEDALDGVTLFPHWKVGEEYKQGERVQYNRTLYKVKQAHTSQADWTPDITASLFEEVARPGQGDSPSNPIPYNNNNMELIEGKYYSQFGVVYICFRSTGVPVYNNLADLVGLYVSVYEG